MISIILPTYNRERYLREAVCSVLEQTYARWELIVVDDGSTDGTVPYLRSLADPRISVVSHGRCGNPARLRNAGIERATGRYVAFLDSDDRWFPTKLAVQLDAMQAAPACRWSFTRFDRMDHDGCPLPVPPTWAWEGHAGWILDHILRDAVVIAMPSVMAEKDLVTEAGGFDESFVLCSDYDCWLRLAGRAQAVAIPVPLVTVRSHRTSHTSGRDVEAHELLGGVYEKALRAVSDETLRRQIRRRHARALIALANLWRSAGRSYPALRALGKSLQLGGVHRAWWAALAKIAVRPLIPDRAMSRYYAWRRSRGGP